MEQAVGLELGSNFLAGVIPTEIGNLKEAEYLSVASNILSGTVRNNRCVCAEILHHVHHLHASSDSIRGWSDG